MSCVHIKVVYACTQSHIYACTDMCIYINQKGYYLQKGPMGEKAGQESVLEGACHKCTWHTCIKMSLKT